MSKFYLTTPIYYVNAAPHVGSAYTTIAADVLARWHRQQGDDTYFITGTAEHGDKIATSAAAAGKTPQQFSDDNAILFNKAWAALHISTDDFLRTSQARHEQAVTQFFTKLKESGKIYAGEYEGLYCVGHEAFIKEAELDEQGNCPDHQKPPSKIKEKNWFFKLSDYGEILKDKITSGELTVAPDIRRNEVLSFIDQGLEDIAISRQHVQLAIKLPWDDSQTIYVWLDELFSYCSVVGYGVDPAQFTKWWPVDIHLVGKDIIKFHCVIWPALLMAIGEPLPKKVFAHGFFTVDGQKISKSLGNAIDPVAIVAEYGADALRYYLLRDIPFGNDGDFSEQRLKDRYNADLANGLGNLVSRTLTMIEQFWPEFLSAGPLPDDVMETFKQIDHATEQLKFDQALALIWSTLSLLGDEVIERNKPWELMKAGQHDRVKEILGTIYAVLVQANQALAPYLPETHEKLTALLAARPLKKPAEPLFARKI